MNFYQKLYLTKVDAPIEEKYEQLKQLAIDAVFDKGNNYTADLTRELIAQGAIPVNEHGEALNPHYHSSACWRQTEQEFTTEAYELVKDGVSSLEELVEFETEEEKEMFYQIIELLIEYFYARQCECPLQSC